MNSYILQIMFYYFLFYQDLFYDLAKQYQAHSYFYITPEVTGKQVFNIHSYNDNILKFYINCCILYEICT